MSLAAFLNQTCVITRLRSDGVGPYNETLCAEEEIGRDIPCRVIEKDIRIFDRQSAESTWVLATLLILPAETDARVDDKATVDGTTYLVKKRLKRQRGNAEHHVSCVVEALNV